MDNESVQILRDSEWQTDKFENIRKGDKWRYNAESIILIATTNPELGDEGYEVRAETIYEASNSIS